MSGRRTPLPDKWLLVHETMGRFIQPDGGITERKNSAALFHSEIDAEKFRSRFPDLIDFSPRRFDESS